MVAKACECNSVVLRLRRTHAAPRSHCISNALDQNVTAMLAHWVDQSQARHHTGTHEGRAGLHGGVQVHRDVTAQNRMLSRWPSPFSRFHKDSSDKLLPQG